MKWWVGVEKAPPQEQRKSSCVILNILVAANLQVNQVGTKETSEDVRRPTQSNDTMLASIFIDVISLATASIVIANERVKDHASSTFLVGPTKLKNFTSF